MGGRLGQIENQMVAIAHQLASSHQQHVDTALRLEEISRTLKSHFSSPPEGVEASNAGYRPVGVDRLHGRREVTHVDPSDDQADSRKGKDLRQGDYSNYRVNLPRLDFLSFDGSEPTDWAEACELYFEMFQISDLYKSRMATMHFEGEAKDWYRCYKIANPQPSWPALVEEVMSFFVYNLSKLVDEFKRVHQIGKVDEYVKKFLQAKVRLTY